MYEDIADFIREIRELDMKIKFDTNGAYPERLENLINNNLLDYVAMDIKAPLETEAYSLSSGTKNDAILNNIKKSIKLIMKSNVDYEFRTTVVPALHKKDDITKIAIFIKGARKYALQNFQPKDTLDPEYVKLKPYKKEEMEDILESVSRYVKKCTLRGI